MGGPHRFEIGRWVTVRKDKMLGPAWRRPASDPTRISSGIPTEASSVIVLATSLPFYSTMVSSYTEEMHP